METVFLYPPQNRVLGGYTVFMSARNVLFFSEYLKKTDMEVPKILHEPLYP